MVSIMESQSKSPTLTSTGKRASVNSFEGLAPPFEILTEDSFFIENKVDQDACIFLIAVIEYMAADILKLAGNHAENHHRRTIDAGDIRAVVIDDKIRRRRMNE